MNRHSHPATTPHTHNILGALCDFYIRLKNALSVWISHFPLGGPNAMWGNAARMATRTSGTVQLRETTARRCHPHCQHGAARVARHWKANMWLRRVPQVHRCGNGQIRRYVFWIFHHIRCLPSTGPNKILFSKGPGKQQKSFKLKGCHT